VKVRLQQIDTTVGDLEGNTNLVIEAVRAAAGFDLLVVPELSFVGYPPGDLVLRRELVDACAAAVHRVAAACPRGLTVVCGGLQWPSDAALPHNVAHILREGAIATVAKRLLPTYDVFDEARWFTPGAAAPRTFSIAGVDVAFVICEDGWADATLWPAPHRYAEDPVADVVAAGARVVVNLSASPWEQGKAGLRLRAAAHAARRHRVGMATCNLGGGNDGLVFDGSSLVVGPGGEAALAAAFRPDALDAWWDSLASCWRELPPEAVARARTARVASTPAVGPALDDAGLDELEAALCLGLEGFLGKQGIREVVLGLSGGIDSALVAYLGARVVGGAHVLAVELPSRFTSELSDRIAGDLVESLELRRHRVPIEELVAAAGRALRPVWGEDPPSLALENLQARMRGLLLMGVSNGLGPLLLATGNKSEIATGYCTLYGDTNGGLAPIGDVYKTQVFALARRVNAREGRLLFPEAVLSRPPTAELREAQTDQDTLPPYECLDAVLYAMLERDLGDAEVARVSGAPPELVHAIRLRLARAEFKRHQLPPVLRMSSRAWMGRRLPIVQRFDRPARAAGSPGGEGDEKSG
jgi:NAD+ synthetase